MATILDIQVQKLTPEKDGVQIFEFLKILEETVKILERKKEELNHLQKNTSKLFVQPKPILVFEFFA